MNIPTSQNQALHRLTYEEGFTVGRETDEIDFNLEGTQGLNKLSCVNYDRELILIGLVSHEDMRMLIPFLLCDPSYTYIDNQHRLNSLFAI